jgi:putative endonuclease
MTHQYYVYILSNRHNTVLYTGVTSDLARRVYEHREKLIDGFTKRHNVDKLVYYEVTNDVVGAIFREKQLKAGARQKKVDLITATNPTWQDLYDRL